MGREEYQYEKSRVETYNVKLRKQMQDSKDAENAELGYLNMNSRMLQMEQQEEYADNAEQWAVRENEHKKRKKDIEKYWRDSTDTQKKELEKKTNGNNRRKDYYSNFSLRELEIFVKNSDNNGNSKEFNDVATDLELLNAMEEQAEQGETIALLQRLSESCGAYIKSRNPISWNGQRRKAMIQQIYDKVQTRLQNMQNQIITEADSSYKEIGADLTEPKSVAKEKVERACKAKFDLISQSLQGHITLDPAQIEQTDKELTALMTALKVQKVDGNQSDTLSTRFFNAIGWADRKPRLSNSFSTDLEHAQVKIKIYHTINAMNGSNAEGMVRQLKGEGEKSRHFLSAGIFGKGTYTAARRIETENSSEEDTRKLDKEASKNSWKYGKNKGSIQLTMLFNEKAKIIDSEDAKQLVKRFEEKYPNFSKLLEMNEDTGTYRASQKIHPASTVILAFYGYNTIRMREAGYTAEGYLDYYVTTDRSAFSVSDDVFIRESTDKIQTHYMD